MVDKPIKILHLIDSGGLYGAEVMLLNLVEQQINQGNQPLILSAGATGIDEKPLETEAIRRQLPLKKWRMKPGLNLSEALRVSRFAQNEGVHVLHSHGYKFNILMGLWPKIVRRIPLVATLHGYVNAQKYSKMWLYETLDRAVIKRMDAVAIVNPLMKEISTVKALPFSKVWEIPNGITMSVGESEEAQGRMVEIEKFLATHSPVIGIVGRLSLEKGHELLIKATVDLVTRYPDLGVLIIGDGYERQNITALVNRLGLDEHVCFAGYCTPIETYMRELDIVAMPSLTEGLPITLLEAMSFKKPVVASSVGGIPILLDNGRCGKIFRPGDSKEIYRAVVEVIENGTETERMVEAAYERVLNDYSATGMASKYQALYKSVVQI